MCEPVTDTGQIMTEFLSGLFCSERFFNKVRANVQKYLARPGSKTSMSQVQTHQTLHTTIVSDTQSDQVMSSVVAKC